MTNATVQSIERYLLSPFTDPNTKKSSHGQSLFALDGIRCVAALTVIASHTDAFGMTGQGGLGVLLFFVLSGFVLMLPFSHDAGRVLGPSEMYRFFVNRALRLLPAFIVVVLYCRWYISANYEWVFTHLTLQGGWFHLWSVAEEGRFYILFPVALAALALCPNRTSRIALLLALIIAARIFQFAVPIDNMSGTYLPFYFWMFLAGALSCMIAPSLNSFASNRNASLFFGCASLLILLALPLSSDAMVSHVWGRIFPAMQGMSLNGWSYPEVWCFLFATLIISVTVCPSILAARVLSLWPLRHIGLLSYSIYLFHIPVYLALRSYELVGTESFLAVLGVTYVISLFTYTLVEKPFLLLKPKSKSRRSPAIPLPSVTPS